ncbi:MAG: hypothetical protein WC980_07200 [Candidatus Brocadiia bacterium]
MRTEKQTSKLVIQMILMLLIGVALYAADDAKIKLTDSTGVSEFAIQDSGSNAAFRVDSDGNTKLYTRGASAVELRLYNSANTFYGGFKVPALAANLVFTLPLSFGSTGQCLVDNDGAGTLSWVSKENALTFNAPLSRAVDTVSLAQANGSTNGYLSSGDWSTFNSHVSSTSNPHSVTKAQIGLGNAENTALSTWSGSANITTVGNIGTGTWQGTTIKQPYLALGTGAGDANTLTLHDFLTGTPTDGYIPKWNSAGGNWVWSADAGGAGSGITSLGGQTGAAQTFSTPNNTLSISSATNNHAFSVTYGQATNTALQGSERNSANGVAPLDASSRLPIANLPTGTIVLLYYDEADSTETSNSTVETTVKSWSLPANTYSRIIIEAEVQGRRFADAVGNCDLTWRFKEGATTRKTLIWRNGGDNSGSAAEPFNTRQSATLKTSFAGGQGSATTLSITGQMSVADTALYMMAHSIRVYGVK